MLEVLKVDVLLQVSAYHHPSLVRNLMTNTVLCGLKSTQSLSTKSLEVLKAHILLQVSAPLACVKPDDKHSTLWLEINTVHKT